MAFWNPSPWQPKSQPMDNCNFQTPAPGDLLKSARPPCKGKHDGQLLQRALVCLTTHPRAEPYRNTHIGYSFPKAWFNEWDLLQDKQCPDSPVLLQSCSEMCVCTSFQDHAGVFQFLRAQGEDATSLFVLQRSSKAKNLPADELEMHAQTLWNDEKE